MTYVRIEREFAGRTLTMETGRLAKQADGAVVVTYGDEELDTVLGLFERMQNHLTAAVVSADILFQHKVLGATVNGTTYCGMRARTTGAPQNHWFGPGGDPRGAGIGTLEAIHVTWSHHREVIMDQGPIPAGWETPPVS